MSIPEQQCDIVMKGGVTSGVVYPLAIYRLSQRYRFQNIGGTSAGAIAAVMTAAAEYGRAHGGFEKIKALPDELSTSLADKFHPAPQFAGLFELVLLLLEKRRLKAALMLPQVYRRRALIGALPGLALLFYGLAVSGVGFLLLGLLFTVIGLFAGAATGVWRQLFTELVIHGYGMCPGVSQPGCKGQAISDWMTDKIDDLADHRETCDVPEELQGFFNAATYERPLTVGDLADRGITVRTVTTDLTTHRPYSLPMDNNIHFFSRSELLKYFPMRVVAHMCAKSAPVSATTAENPNGDLYYFRTDKDTLKLDRDMPIVVLARMSLSFPILFTTVPLYRCDYTLAEKQDQRKPVKCHFSDGGISSNFPVHFFDEFLPHTPTFGIALDDFNPRRYSQRELTDAARSGGDAALRSALPQAIGDGRLLRTREIGGLVSFFMAMFNSAKDWQDSLQSILTGYRERIVTVSLKEDEGGLNLRMKREKIEQLGSFGAAAGDRFVQDFALEEHRWRRLLTEMVALEEALLTFSENFHSTKSRTPYDDLAVNYSPESFKNLSPPDRQMVLDRAQKLAALGAAWKQQTKLAGHPHMPKTRSSLRNIAEMGG